jgi:hypothetical protein
MFYYYLIRRSDVNLKLKSNFWPRIGKGPHGKRTLATVLSVIESILAEKLKDRPDKSDVLRKETFATAKSANQIFDLKMIATLYNSPRFSVETELLVNMVSINVEAVLRFSDSNFCDVNWIMCLMRDIGYHFRS